MGEPNDELMESLKAYSATKYAKTRAEVEREINERWATPAPEPEQPEPTNLSEMLDSSEKKGMLDDWLANH